MIDPTFNLKQIGDAADTLRKAGVPDGAIGSGALIGALALSGYGGLDAGTSAEWSARAINQFNLYREHRPLRALARLEMAGVKGADATTSLDTFIGRVGKELARDVAGLSAADRNKELVRRFGSDAVRVASLLVEENAE